MNKPPTKIFPLIPPYTVNGEDVSEIELHLCSACGDYGIPSIYGDFCTDCSNKFVQEVKMTEYEPTLLDRISYWLGSILSKIGKQLQGIK
jgi:hypothetical protein